MSGAMKRRRDGPRFETTPEVRVSMSAVHTRAEVASCLIEHYPMARGAVSPVAQRGRSATVGIPRVKAILRRVIKQHLSNVTAASPVVQPRGAAKQTADGSATISGLGPLDSHNWVARMELDGKRRDLLQRTGSSVSLPSARS